MGAWPADLPWPERTAFDIINRYMRFADKEVEKRRSEWKTNEKWAYFIGSDRGRLKLTTKPEPYTLARTLNWISRQVAPTWKVLQQIDNTNGTTYLKDILDHAKLTERHKKLIEQQTTSTEEVITETEEWQHETYLIWLLPVLTWSRIRSSYYVSYAGSKSRRQRNWNDGKEKEIMNFDRTYTTGFYLTHKLGAYGNRCYRGVSWFQAWVFQTYRLSGDCLNCCRLSIQRFWRKRCTVTVIQ